MNELEYIIFGIIQGITEPLPISSSGHLFLVRNIFNTSIIQDLNFEIIVNFGSFLAIFFIFRHDIFRLLKSFVCYFLKKKTRQNYASDFKYCWLILIGSVPVGIAGILLKSKIENMLSGIKMLGIAFLLTAIALFLVRKTNGHKKDHDITYKDAIFIGLLQIIALFPGISRSGTVLVGCLICGLTRESALKYTFMLYFPVSIASMGLGIIDMINIGNLENLFLPYLLGLVSAGIVTFYSYQWLSNWVKKGKLWKFSIYCFLMGLFVLFYFR